MVTTIIVVVALRVIVVIALLHGRCHRVELHRGELCVLILDTSTRVVDIHAFATL
jgi:hypothetical protein